MAQKQQVKTAKIDKMAELRKLDISALNKALVEANDNLKNAKKMLKANELPATHVIREHKSTIARIHMAINEKSSELDNKEAK